MNRDYVMVYIKAYAEAYHDWKMRGSQRPEDHKELEDILNECQEEMFDVLERAGITGESSK